MEEQLQALARGLEKGKLTVVTGLRRYGKTSLILTYLNEAKLDYVYIDCRLLPEGMVSLDSFLKLLEEELNRRKWAGRVLSQVEAVGFGGLEVSLKRKREKTLLNVLRALEGRVLVLDEAQELRRSGHRFDALLAYAYDHLNLKIILSGSKIGLLYRFLRVNDPEAPLYGRAFAEVKLRRLREDEAREFLERGFEQEGVKVPRRKIEQAIEKFDGIIGWLTYFGYSTVAGGEDIEAIYDKAAKLALNELEHALKIYGVGEKRYREILKITTLLGEARWSEIKRGVEARHGRIPNNTLSAMLKNLVDSGFLEKDGETYRISDPVLKHGIRKFW